MIEMNTISTYTGTLSHEQHYLLVYQYFKQYFANPFRRVVHMLPLSLTSMWWVGVLLRGVGWGWVLMVWRVWVMWYLLEQKHCSLLPLPHPPHSLLLNPERRTHNMELQLVSQLLNVLSKFIIQVLKQIFIKKEFQLTVNSFQEGCIKNQNYIKHLILIQLALI